MTESETFSFARTPESVPAARATLASFEGRVPDGELYDASLCLSELVTNAVQHAGQETGDDLELDLILTDVALRVEVRDPGSGFEPGDPTEGDESGWGLFIVDQLASRWGVEPGEATVVWFEIDRREESAAGAAAPGDELRPRGDEGQRSSEIANAVARLRLRSAITF